MGGSLTLSRHRPLCFEFLLVCALFFFCDAQAQESTSAAESIDKTELIEQIKQEVIKELLEDGFINEQVELGIQRYIEKQKAAQQAARAEKSRLAQKKAKSVRRPSLDLDHIYGNPDAPISLIEYSDFECPYCKRFHPTAKKVVETYGGKVNWVYRHFPLGFHNPGAQKQAEASECAADLGGNDAFWQFTDAIYARTRAGGKGFPLEKLAPLAEEIGLNGEAFQDCLESGKHTARVKANYDEGVRAGVTGTPGSMLLHNETGVVRVLNGNVPLATVKAQVEQLLK